ncbi:hemagglutinin repeat-containing protein [Avibacterium avium]|uniref:hemagglutinin repeat-containing protein n=1 Tax=Avibacterium avium TaxID=751 RepID=UPI003BF7AF48
MRGQNVGVEVGMLAQAGPQTGVGVYATVGGGGQKMDAERTMYHNSHLDSAQITFNNQNDLTFKGATAKANRIDANVGGKLQIESVQDEQKLKSKSNQAGLSVSVSFGNAWGGNIGFNADSGSENYRQVTEQAGLFAEEGGYHVEANQVHLKGAAIASQNANNSELATNKLSAEHIQNHSSSQAMSGGLSYGFSHQEGHFEEKGTGKVVEAPANSESANNSNNLRWVDEKNSSGFNPSMPMYESHHDSSVTKATITAGKITLNKDSQPVHTTVEELAKTLPISTALDNANPQVEKPRDTQGQLKEQKIVKEAVSQLQSAASTYAANQAKAAQLEADRLQQEIAQEQSKPQATQDKQKIAEKTTALATTLERQEKWSEKGEYKRNLDNLTTIAGGILAGQSGAQIATTLASPTLNEKIKELTTDSNGEVNVLTNTLAHAMLGAVEAAAAKGNITAGALAASASELAAPAITKALGKDNPNQLSAEERQTVTALSALAGSLASGLTAQQNGSATNTVSTLNAAALGGEIGKRAVENNYLSKQESRELINEYEAANSKEKKIKVLRKYLQKSYDNDIAFNSICEIDPVSCLDLINEAKMGKSILLNHDSLFGFSQYYSALLNSNYKIANNKDWTEFKLSNLIPSMKRVVPNQELANRLVDGISNGKVLLTKKSADLLYQLNTDPELKVNIDPSNIYVVGTIREDNSIFSGRVSYFDLSNWSVFGSVVGKRRKDGSYHIFDDKYDFDIRGKYLEKPLNSIRDIETFIGEPRGKGTPYLFEFDRNKEVNYEENN